MQFPALYAAASRASDASQRTYLRLIRIEYGLLVVAATLSLDFSKTALYYSGFAFVFICSLGALLYRSSSKPEQDWYKARALAESIKTSSFRFAMRAEPYGSDDSEQTTRNEFRQMLREVLNANNRLGEQFGGVAADDEQVTSDMCRLRARSYTERRDYYLSERVLDQKSWYTAKAKSNKLRARAWPIIGAAIYLGAIASVLLRIAFPSWEIWPTEPLTVMAASAVGWVQTKRFRELATSYALTAQEIGIMEGRLRDVVNELEFVAFVNEAEQGFSREHTQWIARQQAI